jgi:K+-sensing histidine kinase KdpD
MDSDRQGPSATAARDLDSETLEYLHRATTELYAADSIEECTEQTVSAAIDILGFDWCGVIDANQEREQFEIVATEAVQEFEAADTPLDLDEGIAGTVYQQGDPEIVNGIGDADAEPPDNRIENVLTVPVGEWGIFQAHNTDEDFDETDLRLVELLVAPLATTIERIQRETALRDRTEELERQNNQIEAIHAVSTAMKLTTETEDVYDLFVEAVEQVLDINICTLDECEEEVLKTQAVGSGMDLEDFYTETPLDQPDSLAVETYEHGETIVVDDLTETEYRAANSEYRSVISVPLGEWGVFQAATTDRDAFDETDRQLIELLGDAAEAAVERIERETELEQRAQQLEEQNEQLDQFASRLSHEMRNPLSVLEARMTLARETGDSEHFDHIERSIRRMSRLIDDMLALAREGAVDIMPEPVALDAFARKYWEGIRTPNTELTVETEARIFADEGRLHQLLSNLFRNAVEHTSNGVTVTVGDLPDGFYIEDDGSGIPPEDREAVLATGTSELPHGTGLGLAVVRRVAEAHGWRLRLTESKEGGARFEFEDVMFAEE